MFFLKSKVILLIFGLITLSYIAFHDYKYYRIPNFGVLLFGLLGLTITIVSLNSLVSSIFSGILLSVLSFCLKILVENLKKKQALGLGDIKLLFACGFWIFLREIPCFLIVIGMSGIAICGCTKTKKIPFALPILIGWIYEKFFLT